VAYDTLFIRLCDQWRADTTVLEFGSGIIFIVTS
jgi:hypothetical protein